MLYQYESEYAASLREHMRKQELVRPLETKPPKVKSPPVIEQVRSLLALVPPVPISLDDLRSRIVGRFGRPPQRGEVAHALALLGYVQKRIYRRGFNGRHFWIKQT